MSIPSHILNLIENAMKLKSALLKADSLGSITPVGRKLLSIYHQKSVHICHDTAPSHDSAHNCCRLQKALTAAKSQSYAYGVDRVQVAGRHRVSASWRDYKQY